ncbi:MAG: aminoglycoside phosphotransferase family protein [Spartobacteria bacterium]
MIAEADVISLTNERFPKTGNGNAAVTPLEKGGSERKFYRIRFGDESMIFVKYSGHKEENRHYVDIARFLNGAGVPVPEIYHHDAAEGLIWMQDLGEQDLWSFRKSDWTPRRALYESTLDGVLRMHTQATELASGADLHLERVFDADLYLWEQGYFFENCRGHYFPTPVAELAELSALPALRGAAEALAARPRVLVHRDFQSQNVMIHEGAAWLIDFQGMRYGLAQYDLASLLYDPYVALTSDERCELLAFYKNRLKQQGIPVDSNFDEIFRWCALQRLMQALGAYGFLGLKKNRPDFLAHTPVALRSLLQVASTLDGLGPLVKKLNALV